MKRLLAILMAFTLIAAALAGCAGSVDNTTGTSESSNTNRTNWNEVTTTDDNDDDGDEVDVVPAKTIDQDGEYTLTGDINGSILPALYGSALCRAAA